MSNLQKRKSQKLKEKVKLDYRAKIAIMLHHAAEVAKIKKEMKEKSELVTKLKEDAREIMKHKETQVRQHEPYLLRALVVKQEALLIEEKKVIEKRRLTLLKGGHVIRDGMEYNPIFDSKFIEAYNSYNADRQLLQILDRKLKLRQHKMCRQLLHIFPFRRIRANITDTSKSPKTQNQSSQNQSANAQLLTTNYEIRNMALPSRVSKLMAIANAGGQPEEQMSIGLGYIAHLCTLLSRYLKIPLRHPVICRGSRSLIVDAFLEAETYASLRENKKNRWNPQYPLYSKGVDRGRFKHGVDLLREDICQLCTQTEIRDYQPELFIQNIRVVLYSMALARF